MMLFTSKLFGLLMILLGSIIRILQKMSTFLRIECLSFNSFDWPQFSNGVFQMMENTNSSHYSILFGYDSSIFYTSHKTYQKLSLLDVGPNMFIFK